MTVKVKKIPINYGLPEPLFQKMLRESQKKFCSIQTLITEIINKHYGNEETDTTKAT